MNKGFHAAGHWPTLLAAFLYFDLSFMAWVILGPLGVQIAADLQLDAAEKGLMVATPVLAGAVLRVAAGVLADRMGPKKAGAIGQTVVIAGLLAAWVCGVTSYPRILLLGLVLGVAGASFAAALPLASRWYPPEHQGTALGIAGAGNSGTVLAALFAPGLAAAVGWQNVLGLAAIPLAGVLALYLALAKDRPDPAPPKTLPDYLRLLRIADTWWFMVFYSVTFGGFVGLASSLPIFFNDQYRLSPVVAGWFTAACVFAGSLIRPVGGAAADRVGGVRTLSAVYLVAAAALATVAIGPPTAAMALAVLVAAMLAFGIGNGAVFQLLPQRFRREIGVMTGLVGMSGGLGGFCLAAGLGWTKQLTGGYRLGFLAFAGLGVLAFAGLSRIKRRWRQSWGAPAAIGAARV